jgi:probable phosphoglycerate mutase
MARRLLLVRHGESTWNADARWQGQADPPLSDLGERQARAAAAPVSALGVHVVVTSDLERARRTAELLVPDGVELIVERDFREREAGDWTGLTRAEIEDRDPGALAARRSPSGFEGDESLLARAVPALWRVLDRLTADGAALVVTHGGVIGTVERHLGAPNAAIPNLGGRWLAARDDNLVVGERHLLIDPDDVAVTVPGQI